MRLKLAAIMLVATVLAGGLLRSQNAAGDKGREVADKVVAALGGDQFLHMQSRFETGHIYGFFHDMLSGPEIVHAYFEYLPAPAAGGLGVQERQLLGKKQDYSYLFLPTRGWDVTFRGARPVSDETWNRYHRAIYNDVLYILRCRLNEPGLEFDYIGNDVYLSQHVEILDIIDSTNTTIRVYLDHNTMLPLHESYSWFDDKTHEHNDEAADYDKYRNADGVMWPWVIERHHNGYKVSQMFAESVRTNQGLPARIFELPEGAKLLNKVQ